VDSANVLREILSNEGYFDLRERIVDTLAPGKYEYLMKACALMANGELNCTG